MTCSAPIIVTHPETRLRSEVRCGQCRACRLRRKLSWVGRLLLESKDHMVSRFITLTYADDPGILDYRDFQLFIDRYRKEYGHVRYFVVGEYGGKSGRGHYHSILFGHAPVNVGFCVSLQDVWKRGFCYDGTVTKDSIGYIGGYVFKDNYSAGKVPFVRMSLKPGIGMARIAQMGERCSGYQLLRWPSSYKVGSRAYPLCDGGLARFQTAYLESGGLPPTICNPISRDLRAVNRASETLGRGGSQLSEEASVSFNLWRRENETSALLKKR